MNQVVAGLAALTLASMAIPAWADDFEEGGRLYAVENRKHLTHHEFSLGLGTVPMDAFYKGVTGTFAYTYHFSDQWAWEIASATYSLNVRTGLQRELVDSFAVRPTEFPELNFFVGSNAVWKPLYGKLAFLNDSLIYGEFFLTAGPTVAYYENAGSFIGANLGFGARVFLSQSFSLRLDVRDYQFVSASSFFSDTNNELFIQMGIGLNIR